ncbi:glycogen debranching protein GlgX [Polyangium sp. y55x31]|uniref:glycogen debranching protein GlgX n=1 Tax=Polyangium sp. y55x31 TaxID=3042688 RepID=UPI002482C98E|nr:glycogen debranching protein GlgX [Polyangium sp. y55x31]MDI1480238.1 glycogen debranching protein GlgX [Polyangium sp. y55x31]
MPARFWPGREYPLGSFYDGFGVNFAVFSENAERVELCLFESPDDRSERDRIVLSERTAHVFHGYVPALRPGQLYGYRVHGPYDPTRGLRFNPHKLLCDPYAQAVANEVDWRAPMFPYKLGHPDQDLAMCDEDNAWGAPKAVVVDNVFDWENDKQPRTPWRDTVIYELHVKGFTIRHPDIPEGLRGTYAALASEPVISYLKKLGVTAVELLPVHEMVDDRMLVDRGLRNYWGYNTLSYFAPAGRYASMGRRGEQVAEFKRMVKTLHAAGIEVVLDVVYNHTAEGNHLGPMLCYEGIDNPTYYRLVPGDPRYYMDYTGTGNSLNMRHPQTLKLVMDSLRYWVTEMHVDGFRFDLASTLARELHDVDRLSAFFDIIHQDPILSRVKLIAEPWDVGEGGYQVGNFPVLWTEWNGRYRDAVRRYWKGDAAVTAELGYRLTGSSDLYEGGGRRPTASINFVTAHDGFTLRDLVTYDHKHNEANGEANRDGADNNDSWNHGVEGETDDPAVVALRDRQMRNFFTTLMISQGVPMICGGDELARTQRGNNNAYCQDNEISWHDWEVDARQRSMLEFVRRLSAFRHEQPVLRRKRFFSGGYIRGSEMKDIVWFRPDGREMTAEDWQNPHARALQMFLNGDAIPSTDAHGEPIVGDTLLVLCNAHHEPLPFVLPAIEWGEHWEVVIDTRTAAAPEIGLPTRAGERYVLESRSMAVLRLRPKQEPGAKSAI